MPKLHTRNFTRNKGEFVCLSCEKSFRSGAIVKGHVATGRCKLENEIEDAPGNQKHDRTQDGNENNPMDVSLD